MGFNDHINIYSNRGSQFLTQSYDTERRAIVRAEHSRNYIVKRNPETFVIEFEGPGIRYPRCPRHQGDGYLHREAPPSRSSMVSNSSTSYESLQRIYNQDHSFVPVPPSRSAKHGGSHRKIKGDGSDDMSVASSSKRSTSTSSRSRGRRHEIRDNVSDISASSSISQVLVPVMDMNPLEERPHDDGVRPMSTDDSTAKSARSVRSSRSNSTSSSSVSSHRSSIGSISARHSSTGRSFNGSRPADIFTSVQMPRLDFDRLRAYEQERVQRYVNMGRRPDTSRSSALMTPRGVGSGLGDLHNDVITQRLLSRLERYRPPVKTSTTYGFACDDFEPRPTRKYGLKPHVKHEFYDDQRISAFT